MAKFVFSGDPKNPGSDPESLTVNSRQSERVYVFTLGEALEVDAADISFFAGNSHFTEDKGAPKKKASKKK